MRLSALASRSCAAFVALFAVAAPAQALTNEQLVGRWGFVSYWKEEDQRRSLAIARGECGQPYAITRGPNGGVMLHGADAVTASEMTVSGAGAQARLTPVGGDANARNVRELRVLDPNTFITKFINQADHLRYGYKIYVRCGAGRR